MSSGLDGDEDEEDESKGEENGAMRESKMDEGTSPSAERREAREGEGEGQMDGAWMDDLAASWELVCPAMQSYYPHEDKKVRPRKKPKASYHGGYGHRGIGREEEEGGEGDGEGGQEEKEEDVEATLIKEWLQTEELVVEWSREAKQRHLDERKVEDLLVEDTSMEEASVAGSARVSIYDCIELFQRKEQLEESDMWYCSECKEHRQAWKELRLWKTPPILVRGAVRGGRSGPTLTLLMPLTHA